MGIAAVILPTTPARSTHHHEETFICSIGDSMHLLSIAQSIALLFQIDAMRLVGTDETMHPIQEQCPEQVSPL